MSFLTSLSSGHHSGKSSGHGSSLSILDRVQAQDPLAWQQLVELYGPLITNWCRRTGLQTADIADVTQAVFLAVANGLADYRGKPNDDLSDSPPVQQPENKSHGDHSFDSTCHTGRFRRWLLVITERKIIDWRRSQRPDLAQGGSSAAWRMQEFPDPHQVSDDSVLEFKPEGGSKMFERDPNQSVLNLADLDSDNSWAELIRRALAQIRPEFRDPTWNAFWRSVVDGQTTAVVAEQTGLSPASVRQARSRILRRLRQQLGDL